MESLIKVLFFWTIMSSVVKGYVHLDWEVKNGAFDPNLYKDALDPELCDKQLKYIVYNNSWLQMEFIGSGPRLPRSIATGNFVDLGNYGRCLGINLEDNDMKVQGKYCSINLPMNQNLEIPNWPEFNPSTSKMKPETKKRLKQFKAMQSGVQTLTGMSEKMIDGITLDDLELTLTVCIPKPCTTEQALNALFVNLSAVGLSYTDNYCRFHNDKPWVPVDYVAVTIFSIIGLLIAISTSYDLWQIFELKSDPKSINAIYRSFSVYTNTRRLLTFNSNSDTLDCVDGIRALSMMWVILGHSFSTLPLVINVLDSLDWSLSLSSLWITAGPISVDTFFMLSGLLLVYTATKKTTGKKLLKSLHFFYLHRLLRMFPLLAAAILVQASFFHHVEDGPQWNNVADQVNNCRTYWWSTLIYLQNFLNPSYMCLPHSWYLAIDMQFHILSPVILFWVLSGKRRVAWTALTIALLVVLTAATIYNFLQKFPGSIITPARGKGEHSFYMQYYYINTLTRAPPFFVGMIFGYLLHVYRGMKIHWSKITVTMIWVSALFLTSISLYSSTHPMKDLNWENQTVDSLVNSFAKSTWAVGLAWMIFACVQGYGGPVNWFLSLKIWKLPSRLSYGMYLFHYGIMHVTTSTAMAPIFFSVSSSVYRFLSEMVLAFAVAFVMTLAVDSPFSVLINRAMGSGQKKSSQEGNVLNTRQESKS